MTRFLEPVESKLISQMLEITEIHYWYKIIWEIYAPSQQRCICALFRDFL